MTHCVLTNTKEFKELYSQVFPGLEFKNPEIASLAADVAIWQSENGLDKYPTAKDMLRTSSEIFNQEIGEQRLKQVENLFESNPTLANAVYEALGFKTKADVILPIGTSGSGKSTFIKTLPKENLVVIEPDAMRVEFTGDMNNKSKDKEIYTEAAKRAIAAIKQGKQVVFDTTNLTKDKRLPFIKAIKEAIPAANIQYKLMELNPELAKQRIKAQLARGENRAVVSDETIDRHAASYRQMLEDIKDEPISNFEITPEQKQQAIELFNEYLNSIFPDSKVKEIDNTLYNSILNQLEQENKIEKDCSGGKLKAKDGIRGKFTKGSQWEIYEIFEGKSHKQGGIEINIKNNQINFTNKNGSIKAKYGLVISKDS